MACRGEGWYGKVRHPADGEAWKDFDKHYPDFSQETRNIR